MRRESSDESEVELVEHPEGCCVFSQSTSSEEVQCNDDDYCGNESDSDSEQCQDDIAVGVESGEDDLNNSISSASGGSDNSDHHVSSEGEATSDGEGEASSDVKGEENVANDMPLFPGAHLTLRQSLLFLENEYPNEPFNIAPFVNIVDVRLKYIKPSSSFQQLPRSIKKELALHKAFDLKYLMMYYSLPVVLGILPLRNWLYYSKVMVNEMDNSDAKQLCLKFMSMQKKAKITEIIDHKTAVVGKFQNCHPVPRCVFVFIQDTFDFVGGRFSCISIQCNYMRIDNEEYMAIPINSIETE
ncbi:Zinc finger protein 280C [Frankliniella fusca]|uniref:Zinc finger protein 280C n=1 Tax=Frankliniella fusca TaxID=407009 RepID=A0AAE1LER9_9NEOP|nr:Zinc finger protein 280C [Frankliniella fusca]